MWAIKKCPHFWATPYMISRHIFTLKEWYMPTLLCTHKWQPSPKPARTTPTPQPYHTHTTTTPTPHQHHNRLKLVWCGCDVAYTTPTPQPHHTNFKRLWCWCGVVVLWCGCGVGVVRAGLGEGCHLWATVTLDVSAHIHLGSGIYTVFQKK